MKKYGLTARLADGTPAPNKLGECIKTLKHTLSGLDKQLQVYETRFPDETVQHMKRQIIAIEIALPVLEWELHRRKIESNQVCGDA